MTSVVWIDGGAISVWVLVWYLIFIWFAIVCLRKRHILWFVLGIFLPFLWIIGAILPDRRVVVVEERR